MKHNLGSSTRVCLQPLLGRTLGPGGLDFDYIIFRDPASPKLLDESMPYQLHLLLLLAWLPGILWSWVISCLSGAGVTSTWVCPLWSGSVCPLRETLPLVVLHSDPGCTGQRTRLFHSFHLTHNCTSLPSPLFMVCVQ